MTAMGTDTYPLIKSFVIRFVVEGPSSKEVDRSHFRGTIRHIQSNEEIKFNTLDDVIKFIQCYVPLDVEAGQDIA